ncbi:MAG: hypothetical protein QM764_22550 [Chitinophagaceae bacterium]
MTAFHFWFRDHAEEVIEDLVSARSNGKVNLKLKKFRFNYFSRKMELQNAVFYSTDSLNASTAYQFKVYKMKVEIESLWQLIFHGKLLIESMDLIKPDIEVAKISSEEDEEEKKLSISQEMGRIYNSIHDAIEFLGAKRFSIDEGKFSLINRAEKNKLPISISHIHFLVDKTDSLLPSSKQNPDNMILRSHDQDISLPDGRHRLSFRNLRINVRKRSIEMDSCTIAAGKVEASQAAFRFFFDTLRLSAVDFSTLYKNDLIKADTVYCTKPQINLQLTLNDKKDLKKPPSLKKILQPLTGDLQLGYVSIQNADIDIMTTRKDHSTTFTSDNDNIEISGLHISSDSTDPLVVRSFAMAIRDYETLSRDSTLAFRFDSVKFNNNKVVLSNFTVKTQEGRRTLDAERDYRVPRLELSNLSWDELLFNRNIKASKAVLYNPVLNYKRIKPRNQNGRMKIFRDLGNIDAVTELKQLQVIDGQLNMQLDQRTKITLQDADVLVSSNELLESKSIRSIQRSLNVVTFGKAILSINDLKAEFKKVHFTGKQDQLEAEEVTVYDPSKTLSANLSNVVINELYYNDSTKSVSIDGLEWARASVNLGSFSKSAKPSKSSIVIKNISGNNTTLLLNDSLRVLSTVIQSLSADEIRKPINERTSIAGLEASGNSFSMTRKNLHIETSNYHIDDKDSSTINDIRIDLSGKALSLSAAISSATTMPDIRELMKGNYSFSEALFSNPQIRIISKTQEENGGNKESINIPAFNVAGINLINPALFIEKQTKDDTVSVQWSGVVRDQQNKWVFKNVKGDNLTNMVSINQAELSGPSLSYKTNKGKHFKIENGDIHAETEQIYVSPKQDSSWDWSAKIISAYVRNLNHFNVKNKGELTLDDAYAANVLLTSGAIKSFSSFLQNNGTFRLSNSGGHYSDSAHSVSWQGLSFDHSDRSITLNSFSYNPSLTRDSFVLKNAFQADYITAKTGRIHISNADIESYISDSIFKTGKISIEQPVITAYRDATKPFKHGFIKYLPALTIKRLPPLFSIDTIEMDDATITYSQVDKKTEKTGTIPLAHLNAILFPIRNYDLSSTDSLELHATALIMNTAPMQLTAKESYNDTSAGMRILLSAKATDLTILNPALIPLVSAKLRSGWLDTLGMDVSADEYTAYGKMKMNYKNLKIAIFKKGDPNAKSFLTRIGNFAANAFLLKHNNDDKRTGTVYFERLRERSFFNYLVKMTITGITSVTGLKKDKKAIRRYLKEKQKV